jgi:predicted permease
MRHRAVFNTLLRCYPAPFREEYGAQMYLMFSQQLDEARHSGGPLKTVALWAHTFRDVLTVAPKEHCHVILQDIRFTLRLMAARPGFAAVVILSLALGIGANTAIFGLWNGLLHASLPLVRHPEQLVMLSDPTAAGMWHGDSNGLRDLLTYQEFEQLRDRAASFSAVMASESSFEKFQIRLTGRDWEEVRGRMVSGGYFHLLGIQPAIGRVLTEADDRQDSPYAVISYSYWQRRFGGSTDVLGRTFTLRNAVLTIIGVTPRGFIGESAGEAPDVWISLRMEPQVVPGDDRLHDVPPSKAMWLHVFGRLKPGVSPARAKAECNTIFKAGLQEFYGGVASPERRQELLNQSLNIFPAAGGASVARGDFSTSLTALLAAVGVLLLIACANLANLLLARGAVRRPEMALRLSLGASRGRLVRQLATESLVLAVFGAAGGMAAAWLIFHLLVGMIAEGEPGFAMDFVFNPAVLLFSLAVTTGAALLFGLLPAWQVTRTDAGAALKEQGRSGSSLGPMHWGRSLVSLQLALSLPLLVCAGLLARTVYNLQHVDLGYPSQRLLLMGIDSRIAGYNSARSATLFHGLNEQLQRIPGVSAVSFSRNGVFTGSNSDDRMEVEGFTPTGQDDKDTAWDMVGPRYFSTLGIPLLLGREIIESDDAGAPKVCVINDVFARKFFAGRNPLGLHVTLIDDRPEGARGTAYQVAGVARNAHVNRLRHPVDPRVWIPYTQPHGDNVGRAHFLIRTTTDSTAPLAAARRVVQRMDAALPVTYAKTLAEEMAPSTTEDRITAQVTIVFGLAALLLAAVGLYGVLSYNVSRRRGEIAIRIALGAVPAGVVQMILREMAALLLAGLLAGGALTYAASSWIASQLYGIPPRDPLVLAGAASLLVLVALAAVYLPARRASRADPMSALRQE